MSETPTRDELVSGLRDLADWFENNPELPLPGLNNIPARFPIGIQSWREDAGSVEVAPAFAAAVKALGGKRDKDASDRFMRVEREFAPGLVVEVWAARDEVCEAVVVGTETVEVEEVVQPAVTRTVVEEREVIEWRCAPVLEAAS